MKAADLDETFLRRRHMGTQTSGSPMIDADRFKRCPLCGGFVDILDLAWIGDHEGSLPHPARRREFDRIEKLLIP
jgi:hypothetical protein